MTEPPQLLHCMSFFRGHARRWRRRRSSYMSFFGGCARRWRRRRSFCICFFRGHARRWKRRRSSCTSFLRGRACRWRRRRSCCICFLRGHAHIFLCLRILGICSCDGCEGTSCGPEAFCRLVGACCYFSCFSILLADTQHLQLHSQLDTSCARLAWALPRGYKAAVRTLAMCSE